MLLNFSLHNYRSFSDQLQFSMERDARDVDDGNRWRVPNVSTVAAVYGSNASGKTNFLLALRFVSIFSRNSARMGDAFEGIRGVEPFLLDESLAKEPSDFLIEFIASDNVRYELSFSLTSQEVREEELVAYYSRQPSKLYERSTTASGDQVIRFGPSLKGAKQQLWSITPVNSLFLSVAGGSGKIDALKAPYLELTRGISSLFLGGGTSMRFQSIRGLTRAEKQNPSAFNRLVEVVRHADFGIEDIEVRRREVSEDQDEMDNLSLMGRHAPFVRERADVLFFHRGPDGLFPLSYDQESEGTISALSFFSRALDVLEGGSLLLVDELDMSLHPSLVREFVSLFAGPDTNPNQAQLIFTTHDVSLISVPNDERRVLGRDQVWFCEKDELGRSELIPATSYSPRKGENLGRNYLNGIYGALPRTSIFEEVAKLMSYSERARDE